MFSNSRRLTIEWGQCDPAGIVFFPRYFEMFDASTAALFVAATGLSKREMLEKHQIIGFPMVDTRAVFHAPAKFGDAVEIRSAVISTRRSSFQVEHSLFRDGVLAVQASETRVWTGVDPDDPSRMLSKPLPQEIALLFARGAAEGQAVGAAP